MSSAGIPLSADTAVTTVTPTVHRSDTKRQRMNSGTLVLNLILSVKPYIILYTSQITYGKSFVPPANPRTQPSNDADPA